MLREGEQVGPYQIEAQLGQGGMATVYKAYHARLDRHVALKVMHESLQQDPGFLSRFEREARIIAKLEHPNIVPVYDFDEHEGDPYLVMKFVEGQTLADRLREGMPTLDDILRILTPIAAALTYAHEQGVLHRDIKPSNIVLDEKGTPYLTDFGLARLAQQGASSLSQGTMIGTPHYVSPEQALGQGELDARTDVYSLGVMLYELVVGRVPFGGETAFSIVHDHIYTPLPAPHEINPEVPPQVEAVLVKALAKDPAARYASASEMMRAFREAVEASGLETLSPERASMAAASLTALQAQKPQATPAAADETEAVSPAEPRRRPRPPRPPAPPRAPSEEFHLDLDLSDLGKLGEQIEAKVNQFVSFVGEKMDEETLAEIAAEVKSERRGQRRRGPQSEEERIRSRIEKRIKERGEFFTHLGIFAVTNVFLWVLWAVLGASLGGICAWPWALIVTLGWGIGIVAHFLDYYNKYGPGAEQQEREIQREIARARRQGLLDDMPDEDEEPLEEKRKHEDIAPRRARLSEDGELTDSFAEEWETFEKPKRDQG